MINFTPLLRAYAGRRRRVLAGQDAVATQEKQLLSLVRQAAKTKFGKDHGFSSIRSVADFQSAVPLRDYHGFWEAYWKDAFPLLDDVSWPGRIPYFAVTSGTTSGTSKYIPVSHAMNRANARAGLDILAHHAAHWPGSKALGGKGLMLGGSTDLVKEAPGVFSGDLSGIAVKRVPWWAKQFMFPPLEIALLTDWEEKVGRIARLARETHISIITGTPSWLLILFEKQQALADADADADAGAEALYPKLDVLVHGGVNFKPYRERFEAFLGDHAELREVYPASEGFIALQDETPADGLRLLLDNGLFFEFVPLEELELETPTRHTLATVEPDVNYALVLSSCAGCWAYVIGDTVRFISTDPPRVVITGRTSYFLSAFGEHVIEEELEEAVTEAASALGNAVSDFSVGAVYPQSDGELGRHLFVVEFDAAIEKSAIPVVSGEVDRRLSALNDDYKAHRSGGFGMDAPEILPVPSGFFAAWMKSRGRLGGQNKVPRIINDATLFDDLVDFARKQRLR
ncbi:MAG: GH3 auxin-responsive promoter family protein [Alphaproteobacteria bacterium]